MPLIDLKNILTLKPREPGVTYGAVVRQAATKINFMFILKRQMWIAIIFIKRGISSPNDQRNRSGIQEGAMRITIQPHWTFNRGFSFLLLQT